MGSKKWVVVFVVVVGAIGSYLWAQSTSDLLEKAIYAEETVGNVTEAIKIYKQIVEQDESNRAVAAQAYFRLGSCYAKMGADKEAVRYLDTLITKFPDQKELIERARPILDQLTGPDPAKLMPPGVLAYLQLGSPGRQVEKVLNILKDTPFADPLNVLGVAPPPQSATLERGSVPPGAVTQREMRPLAISGLINNPALLQELKKIRGAAVGVTDINPRRPPSYVAAIYPGESDMLRGTLTMLLTMAGQPGEPIEGMQTFALEQGTFGYVAMDGNVVIAANPRDQLVWSVKQYKGLAQEPTLASKNESFAKVTREAREQDTLTLWVDLNRVLQNPEIPRLIGMSPRDVTTFDTIVDPTNIGDLAVRLVIDETNPFAEVALTFKEGHRFLPYNLINTPNLRTAAFGAIPPEAVALVSVSLNESHPGGNPAAMEAVRQITGLDLGREIFANIEQLTLFMLPPTADALNHPLAREFRPIPVSIGLAIASRDPGKTRMVVDTLLSVVTQVFNIQNNVQSETKDDGPVRKYAFGPVSEREPRLYLYMAEAGESTVFSIDPNVVDAARRSAETGESVLTAGPLSEPLQRLESDTSKLVLVNAGGLATALFGADTQVPQEARGMISSIASGLRDTTVRLQTREGANHFALRIGVDGFSGQALNSLLFPFIRMRVAVREEVEAQMQAEVERENGIRDSVRRAKADMRSIAVALEAYSVDKNSYPLPMDENMKLVELPPQGNGIAQGYVSYLLNTPVKYMSNIPSDPFGGDKTYRYALDRRMGWILASPGPDGVMNGDISAYLDPNKADRKIEKFLAHYGQGGEFIEYDASNGTVSPGDIFLVGQPQQ